MSFGGKIFLIIIIVLFFVGAYKIRKDYQFDITCSEKCKDYKVLRINNGSFAESDLLCYCKLNGEWKIQLDDK